MEGAATSSQRTECERGRGFFECQHWTGIACTEINRCVCVCVMQNVVSYDQCYY